MNDLETRVRKLEKSVSNFSEEIRLAYHYIDSDAAGSLTKSRVVTEKLLLGIYKAEMGHEPRKPLLGDMLVDNQFTKKIERRILSRMNTIRDMGNLGPHGEAVKPSDAVKVLDDVCEVLDWYLTKYLGRQQEPEEQAQDGAFRSEKNATAGGKKGMLLGIGRRWWLTGAGCAIALIAGVVILQLLPARVMPTFDNGKNAVVSESPAHAEAPASVKTIDEESRAPVYRGPKEVEGAVRVKSINVTHFKRIGDSDDVEPAVTLGEQSFAATLGDQVTVEATLSKPAYAYLLAFRPDGVMELCFPEDESVAPPLTDKPRYPSQKVGERDGLSDGSGMIVFAVIASNTPLPPFRDWKVNKSPAWAHSSAGSGEVLWTDGHWLEELTSKGRRRAAGEKALGSAAPLLKLTEWLKKSGNVDAAATLGFNVQKRKEEAKSEPKPK